MRSTPPTGPLCATEHQLWERPGFRQLRRSLQRRSVKVLPDATITPSSSDYTIWAQGLTEATGAIAQGHTSVSQAIGILKNYVVGQLGSSATETAK